MRYDKLSVITPFYQGEKYIDSLASNLNQAFLRLHKKFQQVELEWIIVNDSPWAECDVHRNVSFPVVISKNASNIGILRSRVRGIEISSGNFVLLLDQDDAISEDFFLSQYESLVNSLDAMVVCNGIEELADKRYLFYRKRNIFSKLNAINYYIRIVNPIRSPGQCLIRKASIPKEWLNSSLKNNGSDDLLLYLMMLSKGEKIGYNDKILYIHKYTGKNLSSDNDKMSNSSNEVVKVLRENASLSEEQLQTLEKSIAWYRLSKKQKITGVIRFRKLIEERFYWKVWGVFSKKLETACKFEG